MITCNVHQKAILLIIASLLAACSLSGAPAVVGEIQAQTGTTIVTGDKISLTIPVSGNELRFEWNAQKGKLSDSAQPAVIYTAPDSPGLDTVTVKVIYSGGQVIRNINFDVVAPPTPTTTRIPFPEDTPTSTAAPTQTAAPRPIACNLPPVTKNLFPQLADVNGQFPMYGPVADPNILCEAVYDIVHTPGRMAVHVKYESVGGNSGWWGIAIQPPDSYDTSHHNQMCFWAYAQAPDQSFRVKMRDTSHHEQGVVVTIQVTNQWNQICTNISEFSARGIQVDKMENVNIGFEQPTGSSEVWLADFEFN